MLNRKKVTLLSGLIVLSLSASVRAEDVVLRALMEDVPKRKSLKNAA